MSSGGGAAEKPSHNTASISYATTPSSTPDFIPYSQPPANTVAASCIPGPGDKIFPTVTVSDHANPPTEIPCMWHTGPLVTGQASVVTDSDRYNYLTHSYQGKDFVTYEVRKTGKRIPLSFQESWLTEYERLSYCPSQGGGYCKYCILFKAACKLTKCLVPW